MVYKSKGIEVDSTRAIYYFKKSASQRDPYGPFYITMMYYQGIGVKQDYKIAFKWFWQAEGRRLSGNSKIPW